MTIYINLFGGPGVGKSTRAASLFAEMKKSFMSVELVTEVAKDFVWENRMKTLEIQPYVTIKQYRNLVRLKHEVEYVITDAPILLGCVYAEKFANDLPVSYTQLIADLHREILQPNVNIVLKRQFPYEERGRYQSEQEAIEIDKSIKKVLALTGTQYVNLGYEDLTINTIKELSNNFKLTNRERCSIV